MNIYDSNEDSKPAYYGILPANVRYDKSLPANAKLLYSELTALSNKYGYCFASNSYFAALYGVTRQAVSKWIKILEQNGYIKTEQIIENKVIIERRIYINVREDKETTNEESASLSNESDKKEVSTYVDKGVNARFTGVSTLGLQGYQQKFTGNNTRCNNTRVNNLFHQDTKSLDEYFDNTKKFDRDKKNKITQPELSEIINYVKIKNLKVDPEKFYYFYKSKNWTTGGDKISNWRALLVVWDRNEKQKINNTQGKKSEYDFNTVGNIGEALF